MGSLVTLTTDFGLRDPYVSAMKGILHRMCPGLQVVDLSHDIPPQNLVEGALFLAGATRHFPPNTIHVAVIDPGVGTDRQPIIAVTQDQTYVCPDNGLLTLLLQDGPLEECRVIANPDFMLPEVSPTFHGRDIFAPAAARIAAGTPLAEAGPAITDLSTLQLPQAQRVPNGTVRGNIIHADRFGNAITNIPRHLLCGALPSLIQTGDSRFSHLSRVYADVDPGKPVVLFGSTGYLEVSVNQGNAMDVLGLHLGDDVLITM